VLDIEHCEYSFQLICVRNIIKITAVHLFIILRVRLLSCFFKLCITQKSQIVILFATGNLIDFISIFLCFDYCLWHFVFNSVFVKDFHSIIHNVLVIAVCVNSTGNISFGISDTVFNVLWGNIYVCFNKSVDTLYNLSPFHISCTFICFSAFSQAYAFAVVIGRIPASAYSACAILIFKKICFFFCVMVLLEKSLYSEFTADNSASV